MMNDVVDVQTILQVVAEELECSADPAELLPVARERYQQSPPEPWRLEFDRAEFDSGRIPDAILGWYKAAMRKRGTSSV